MSVKILMKNKQCRTHRRSQGEPRWPCATNFNQGEPRWPCATNFNMLYLVIFCFEKRRPKQKCWCLPEVKHFPPKFWVGDTIGRTSNDHADNKNINNHQHDTIVAIVFLLWHKTWNSKKMSIFCHLLFLGWCKFDYFSVFSTTCTKFW